MYFLAMGCRQRESNSLLQIGNLASFHIDRAGRRRVEESNPTPFRAHRVATGPGPMASSLASGRGGIRTPKACARSASNRVPSPVGLLFQSGGGGSRTPKACAHTGSGRAPSPIGLPLQRSGRESNSQGLAAHPGSGRAPSPIGLPLQSGTRGLNPAPPGPQPGVAPRDSCPIAPGGGDFGEMSD
jgi:hypothetical protein